MKRYIGTRVEMGPADVTVVVALPDGGVDHRYALPHICRHSPDGFQWGYGGSGPADLALSILTDAVGKEKAEKLYQAFKWKFLAPICGNLLITEEEIQTWIKDKIMEFVKEDR